MIAGVTPSPSVTADLSEETDPLGRTGRRL